MMPSVLKICTDFKSRVVYSSLKYEIYLQFLSENSFYTIFIFSIVPVILIEDIEYLYISLRVVICAIYTGHVLARIFILPKTYKVV